MTTVGKTAIAAGLAFAISAFSFAQLGFGQQSTTGAGAVQSPSAGQPIGRDDWVRQPGDQPGPSSGMGMHGGSATQSMGSRQHMGGGTVPGPGTHGHSSSPKAGETKELQDKQHSMPAMPSHSSGSTK
ncbi:MAG: hypothetical protein HYX37_12955 [Rhizobiales bacterium]|nr:hypothetical protein [Hyphomicrobiales bacterium]